MISSAVAELKKKSSDSSKSSLNAMTAGEVRYPWTYVQDEEAPEDAAATPLPCSFTDALHYMEMSYDQAVQEYLNLFETHVEKQFTETTKILELLRNKGVKVFVPQNLVSELKRDFYDLARALHESVLCDLQNIFIFHKKEKEERFYRSTDDCC